MTDFDPEPVINAVASHAAASGFFDRVNEFEPVNPPGTGMSAAVWCDRIDPVRSSGLASTSGRVLMYVRLYLPLNTVQPDQVDVVMIRAVWDLLNRYVGGYTLGGLIRSVDVRGAEGVPISARAGYIEYGGKPFRAYTVALPLIINDMWTEAP
jgi:hypothetical protein